MPEPAPRKRRTRFETLQRTIMIGAAADAGVWPRQLADHWQLATQHVRNLIEDWRENRDAILTEYKARRPQPKREPKKTEHEISAEKQAARAELRRQHAIATLERDADRRAGRPPAAEYPPRAEMTAKAWQEERTQIADALDPPTD